MPKETFNRKMRIFCGPLKKELRKRLVKFFVWSVALYGAETWTLRRSEEKRIEAFEMWIWRRMERVKRTDRIFCVIIRCKSNGTEKNSLRRRDLNPGFQLYVLMLYQLSHTGYHPGVGQNLLTCYGTKIVLQWLKEGKLVINKISQLGPMDPSTNSRFLDSRLDDKSFSTE
ncbi:hypothetical protein ANN_02175 [Periplaneta americana]|uniref:Uncharacterized protein n=1 Tax=Periplaneta americana TaxID=6978 RepID=A0ABQ8TVI7_PERAM|nr:hypothetical protein ANN_02175 [Periplaneta americana]